MHCMTFKILIWQEREQEDVDFVTINLMLILQALRECGLLNFWAIQGMRAQVDILQWLVDRWNAHDQCFVIGGHGLKSSWRTYTF